MKARLKRLYDAGRIDEAAVIRAEQMQWITREDVIEILGHNPYETEADET